MALERSILVAAGAAIVIWLAVWFVSAHQAPRPAPILVTLSQASGQKTIGLVGRSVQVDLALTPLQQAQGLGGRDGLATDTGMLFVFKKDSRYAFWMKDMKFSIDMVWISATGTVVYVAPDVAPETYPKDFITPTPARYVLELPAGWMAAHDAKIGDKVSL